MSSLRTTVKISCGATTETGLLKKSQSSWEFHEDAWSCSAAFADLDSDGDLDLYVVNYVNWNSDDPPCFCPIEPPVKISCSPMSLAGQADSLYCNQGDGAFQEIGEAAGITIAPHGTGLGVVVCDFDSDERLDVYVANDTSGRTAIDCGLLD